MKLKPVLFPYSKHSEGAKALAAKMGIEIVTDPELIKKGTTVIGWGNSKYIKTELYKQFLNPPGKVAIAVDKKATYERLKGWGVRVPEFTDSRQQAQKWQQEGKTVVCRLTLDGKAGEGITIVDKKTVDMPHAPLYTVYVNKTYEYRVHVAFGSVIHVRKKVKPSAGVSGDPRIASHLSGWLFVKSGFTPPPDALRQAIKAVQSLGLDFGAVDILYDQPSDKAYVCEVNTAPGIEVSEVAAYADAFNKYLTG